MTRGSAVWTIISLLALSGCTSGGGSGGSYGGGNTNDGTDNTAGGADTDDDGQAADGGDVTGEGGVDLECAEVTYESFARGFFENYCTRCHNSALSGTNRNGAPAGFNWDDPDSVMEHLDRIGVRAVDLQSMPPNPPFPDDEQRETLGFWIECGAPAGGAE